MNWSYGYWQYKWTWGNKQMSVLTKLRARMVRGASLEGEEVTEVVNHIYSQEERIQKLKELCEEVIEALYHAEKMECWNHNDSDEFYNRLNDI